MEDTPMRQDKTKLIEDMIVGLEKSLPAIFSRRETKILLGGAIAPGTLKNLGKDIVPYTMSGRNAIYEKVSFLKFLRLYLEGGLKNAKRDK